VQNAPGLLLAITFEGIGAALKSGLLAADSISEAASSRKEAANINLKKLTTSVVKVIKGLHALNAKLEKSLANDAVEAVLALKSAYVATLFH
jgi:flavin-dependent dehydrogenase